MNTESNPFAQDEEGPLGMRVDHGADATEIPAAMVAVWRDVDAALRPIIGQRGVLALFQRCLDLTAVAHPWLAAGNQATATELDPTTLEPLFSNQAAATAMVCGNRMLLALQQILGSLIGTSLTGRLLQAVWAPSIGQPPKQDS